MGLLSAVLIAVAAWLWLGSSSGTRMKKVIGGSESMLDSNHGRRGPRTRLGSKRQRARDTSAALLAQAPTCADLLATAIAAGATVPEAMVVVARAVDEPMRSRLQAVIAAMDMGADANAAWSTWLDEPALSPIARVIVRSQHSGSPLTVVLDAAASDMRQVYRAAVEARARAAGVRSVAPLALCYLPAYLLVGVVPVVAGFAGALFG